MLGYIAKGLDASRHLLSSITAMTLKELTSFRLFITLAPPTRNFQAMPSFLLLQKKNGTECPVSSTTPTEGSWQLPTVNVVPTDRWL